MKKAPSFQLKKLADSLLRHKNRFNLNHKPLQNGKISKKSRIVLDEIGCEINNRHEINVTTVLSSK